ncbi:ferredoxin--NADP reductase [Pollutibacter soli]|uniref:ferredoxin--NADP reductase n=1 Tax=Pollutibacter soli TaxID=3034157 RepID=UPI00301322FC
MNPPPWRRGEIVRIKEEAPHTRRFWIKIPELESFQFQPGQHITLELPIDEKQSKRIRSYSIASWPNNSNIFELIIVHNQDIVASEYLFKTIQEGDEIRVRGPQGRFLLPHVLDKDIFFICTGTGIAPFRSMLHHIVENNLAHKNIYLIFGTRTTKDLLFHDEFLKLAETLPQFHYMPVLSREEWAGETGYVHEIYKRMASTKKPAYFYLCGWKQMIEEAKQHILEIGYDQKDIHHEMYG